jgi:hypothetical protein
MYQWRWWIQNNTKYGTPSTWNCAMIFLAKLDSAVNMIVSGIWSSRSEDIMSPYPKMEKLTFICVGNHRLVRLDPILVYFTIIIFKLPCSELSTIVRRFYIFEFIFTYQKPIKIWSFDIFSHATFKMGKCWHMEMCPNTMFWIHIWVEIMP